MNEQESTCLNVHSNEYSKGYSILENSILGKCGTQNWKSRLGPDYR